MPTNANNAVASKIVRLEQRLQPAELLFKPGALALDDLAIMADAWR